MVEEKNKSAGDDLSDGALTLKAAVQFSGVPRTGLYLAMARGELPYLMRGRHRMITRRAIVAWMARTFTPAAN